MKNKQAKWWNEAKSYLMLNDPIMKKIASKGRINYHKKFNSNIVSEYIINKTLNKNNKKKYFWN